MSRSGITHSKPAISTLIAVILALHFVPVVFYEGRRQTLWPFLTWTMYKNSRPPGPIEARKTRVIGVTRQSREEEVTARLAGLPAPTLVDLYTGPMRQGDSAAARRLFSRLNARRVDSLVQLRVEVENFRLTDTGVVSRRAPDISYHLDALGP
jgi:hypothetical protein